jgi:hypothetical protein
VNKKKVAAMNKNAKKWVKALRSGKYKQVTDRLTELDNGKVLGHCCLGVLCELAVKDGVRTQVTNTSFRRLYSNYGTALPPQVQKWAGLRSGYGQFGDVDESLADLNDSGKSFKYIARVIEQKAKELFV